MGKKKKKRHQTHQHEQVTETRRYSMCTRFTNGGNTVVRDGMGSGMYTRDVYRINDEGQGG